MKKSYQSEVEADGTDWSVVARVDESGHITAEVVGASPSDGTVSLQLTVDGNQSHVDMLEDIARELRSSLYGVPRSRKPGSFRLATIRQGLPRAYLPWTEDEEATLLERWDAGDTIELIAQQLERGAGGVRSRLVRLGRIEEAS